MGIKSWLTQAARTLKLAVKPGREELWLSIKISLLGIGAVGLIGFVIKLLSYAFGGAAAPHHHQLRRKLFYGEERRAKASKNLRCKTTTGQERNVARLIASKVEMNHIPIKALLVPDTLKGYVFVEADGPHLVEEAISGVRHVRSRIPGLVSFTEIERYIVRKPVMEDLDEDDVVEITGGPFKGMRAKITRLDKSKGEVTLELLEATFTLPITVHSDYVKLVEKAK